MGMITRQTTASNLQKAINNNMVTIQSVKVESKDDHETKTITSEQFKDNLDFYMESGIFADTLDFKYELQDKTLSVDIGFMSCYCDKCITVEMIVNDGVSKDDLEKSIKKVDIEEMKEAIRKIDRTFAVCPDNNSPENLRKLNELIELLNKEQAKMEKS